jgi:hypothetical protein
MKKSQQHHYHKQSFVREQQVQENGEQPASEEHVDWDPSFAYVSQSSNEVSSQLT